MAVLSTTSGTPDAREIIASLLALLIMFCAAQLRETKPTQPAEPSLPEPFVLSPEPPKQPLELRTFGDWGARHVVISVPLIRGTENTEHPRLDLDAMYRPHRSDESYKELRAAIGEEFAKYETDSKADPLLSAPPELAQTVFDFYYSDNRAYARHFFNSCWPKHRPGKEGYWRRLMKDGAQDKYWPVVMQWNDRIEQTREIAH